MYRKETEKEDFFSFFFTFKVIEKKKTAKYGDSTNYIFKFLVLKIQTSNLYKC